MKNIAIFAPELPVGSAGMETAVPPGVHPVGDPPLEATPPAVPVPPGADAGRAVGQALPLGAQVSVVTKVARLLISRGMDPRARHAIPGENGFSHYKVLMSLRAKQSCP